MKSTRVNIFLGLILLFISLAFLNVGYNSVKSIKEFQEWIPLSDQQKRQKIFGDSYDFSVFLHANTSQDKTILLFSDNGMVFYYTRYFLYSQLIMWAENQKTPIDITKSKQFTYIATYDKEIFSKNYKKINVFVSKISGKKGSLYQLQ